ncbi:MAG: arginine--tRNA ligase [Holophagales bacterium]|nr:MAG: arginine--tRNA ligase [Holophagales bacterium]
MLRLWKRSLASSLADRIRERTDADHLPVVEVPPRRALGDLALPAALHLAKALKRPPRQLAGELAEGWQLPDGVRELRVEGAGYLNVFLQRSRFAASLLDAPVVGEVAPPEAGKVVVEHTNINPNKAAHIGHLRNAVLGDLLARSLRALGHDVEVQNYIDDTGVQLADVVVGFMDVQPTSLADVKAIDEPFDYVCWDLYARVGKWYAEDPTRDRLRRETLHALELGEGERAQMGRLIARRIVRRHLTTMARLGIGYDLLTHESDILSLHFFDTAFELLKASGAVRLEADGKNAGCWVMPLADSEEFAGLEDPDKVIVRSDGTVTYVGKDIAYQLWKFGLLGRDFAYRYWMDEGVWETATEGAENHPRFGGAARVINVIDARQSYLQKIVRAGLESLGHREAAASSVHFAYEMVSLSAATARALGYVADGEEGKSLEMSGRKGIGVKADDLLDRLEEKAREQIAQRHHDLPKGELHQLAREIATAALRFFMAKATTTRVIAFDLDEALAFEGETGPYLQYSLVRARNIQRKLATAGLPATLTSAQVAALPEELWSDDLWELVHLAASGTEMVEKAAASLELSGIARHALDLAQRFHALYHHHPVLHEENVELRQVRQAAFQICYRSLKGLCELLGIAEPARM